MRVNVKSITSQHTFWYWFVQGCQRTKKGWLVTLTSDTLKDLLELRCVDYVARINSHHKIFVGCKKKLWCSCKSLRPVLEYFYITKMTAIDHILPLFLLIVFLLLTNAWYINKVIKGPLCYDFWFLISTPYYCFRWTGMAKESRKAGQIPIMRSQKVILFSF